MRNSTSVFNFTTLILCLLASFILLVLVSYSNSFQSYFVSFPAFSIAYFFAGYVLHALFQKKKISVIEPVLFIAIPLMAYVYLTFTGAHIPLVLGISVCMVFAFVAGFYFKKLKSKIFSRQFSET